MKNYSITMIFGLIFIVGFSSCLDLAPMMFNPSELDEYKYDNFDPDNNIDPKYDILPNEINEFTVESDLDGDIATIYGAYLGDINTISEDTVILYCHGNAAHMDLYFQRAKLLYNANGKSNYGVLSFDYRGFGRSESNPTEEGLKADTKAMIQWLKSQGLTSDRLIIYGFSLGSIPAVSACLNDYGLTPSKLMLEAPIGSIDAMAEDGSGLSIQGSLFSTLTTNNIEDIKAVDKPLYWIHGDDDDFLAMITHGYPIYLNHDGVFKVAEVIQGGNHGDTPFVFGIEEYISSISSFIRQTE